MLSNSWVPPEVISQKNITFAFMLSDFYATRSYDDPYYGRLMLQQKTMTVKTADDGSHYRDIQVVPIPFSSCKVGQNLFYPNVAEISEYNIGTYYCPDSTNLTLQGNFYSPVHSRVELIFKRCSDPYPTCANETEFQAWVGGVTMIQIMISTQFDINDYETPIKYYMEDVYYPLLSNYGIQSTIWYKKNFMNLYDNVFGLFNTKTTDYFYQMNSQTYLVADPDTGPGTGYYFYQMFKMDAEVDTYTRSVYTIMGVAKDTGGFYNALFFVGLFLYSRF